MLALYVALGGAAGALARYALGGWIHSSFGGGFPWGTLTVNVLGCLLIGFAARYLESVAATSELRALVGIGVLGGFTTFSTFAYETTAMLLDGDWRRGALYLTGSFAFGLAGVLLGFGLAERALQLGR